MKSDRTDKLILFAFDLLWLSDERIQAAQILECADDAEVLSKATALLSSKPEHQSIEICTFSWSKVSLSLNKDTIVRHRSS